MRAVFGGIGMVAAAALLIFLVVKPGSVERGGGGGGPEPLRLAASIHPLADWLREIGGDRVEVHCFVRGGADPHHFQPGMDDAIAVSRARAMFAVGLDLDPWARDLHAHANRGEQLSYFATGEWIEARRFASPKTVEVGPRPAEPEHNHVHTAGGLDPHYWQDPRRAAAVVQRMAAELSKLDPANSAEYAARAEAYVKRLSQLDTRIEQLRASLPSGARVVTFHDAYSYLLDRLGVGLAAVIQVSPGVEPTASDVVKAVETMRRIEQTTVFREPAGNVPTLEEIARRLGGRVELLDPLDTEYSPAGTAYIERIEHNLRVLEAALRKDGKAGQP